MSAADAVQRAGLLLQQGAYAQAHAMLLRHLKARPADADACYMAALCLLKMQKMQEADFYAERATQLRPSASNGWSLAGVIQSELGRRDVAMASLRRALALNPDDVNAQSTLGTILLRTGDPEEALELLGAAASREVLGADITCNYAAALLAAGRTDEALAALDAAERRGATLVRVAVQRAAILNYTTTTQREALFAAHRRAGQLTQDAVRLAPLPPPKPTQPRSAPPLKVALVSPDLRRHSVAFFLEPLLEHLDRARVRVTGVDVTGGKGDEVTQRLRQRCDAWRDLGSLSDHAAALALRDDGYDIIIELAGYTSGSRIGSMAYAPAPIIVSYLGYPCSTGMPGVTHRIVDALTDPPGAEAFASEKLVRLDPCFLCYRRPFDAPAPRREARRGEGVVFASFNAIMKIQPPTLDLWASVLNRVPGSTLLLKFRGLSSPRAKDRLRHAMVDRGVDTSRLELVDHDESHAQHLKLYERVDIALDTYPYHGTTTTCDALAMGVPVITRVGETHAARVGLSLLSAVGLADLAAFDDETYVNAAERLARSPSHLAQLRATLPDRLARSPLCDEKAYAERFTQALEGIARERGLLA